MANAGAFLRVALRHTTQTLESPFKVLEISSRIRQQKWKWQQCLWKGTHVDSFRNQLQPSMKPRITIITLGVDDLDKSLTFYRDGLGLPTQGISGKEFEYGAVAFFDLQNGLKLALWPRKSIAHDTHLPVQAPSATDFTLAHNPSGNFW